jgi:hypothetical protein
MLQAQDLALLLGQTPQMSWSKWSSCRLCNRLIYSPSRFRRTSASPAIRALDCRRWLADECRASPDGGQPALALGRLGALASRLHPATLPTRAVLRSRRRLAAPLARRQRRALPPGGPPGARRATYRQGRLVNGSLSAAGTPHAAIFLGLPVSQSRPTAPRDRQLRGRRGTDQETASEDMWARVGARVAVIPRPGRGRRG